MAYIMTQNIPIVTQTSLALITRDCLSDIHSVIPSKMDMVLEYFIQQTIIKFQEIEKKKELHPSLVNEMILYLEALYGCLYMLVKRCTFFLILCIRSVHENPH